MTCLEPLLQALILIQSSEAVTNTLIEATGWDVTELSNLISQNGFNLTDADFKNEIWPLRLQACLKLSRRLGVSAEKLFNWAKNEPHVSQAEDIVRSVKAKYEDEQWLTVGKPLNDGLRESQKAALISYVLREQKIIDEGITDSNQLFEYFLIDVEMSACMMTSRIKQAISLGAALRPALLDEPGAGGFAMQRSTTSSGSG